MKTITDIIFHTIEKSYLTRCSDTSHASTTWKDVMGKYPPEKLYEFSRRPSLDLARQSGDLALALLWGAQATLIRPMIKTAIEHETNYQTLAFLENIDANSVGALAIAEDKTIPFTATEKNGKLILNGEKKYITGGAQSDFLLLAEKSKDDKKPSGIIFLATKDIPGNSFQPLDMRCLSTSRHASLNFTDLHIPSENRLSLTPKTIRKILKSSGIIEQSLIMEAVTGLSLYLAGRIKIETGSQISSVDDVKTKLQKLSSEIDQQIKSALQGEFIQPIQLETEHIVAMLNEMKQSSSKLGSQGDDELFYRFRDIQFFLGEK